MKKILRLLFIVVGVAVLVSGQSQGEYSLTQFSEGTANYQSISIKITDKFISVRGGCNIHTGYFNVTDNTKVGIGPFSSTQMACEKDYDTVLISKLATASSFTTSQSGVLTLLDKDKKVIAKLTKSTASEEKIDINSIIAQLKGQNTSNTTQNQSATNASEGTKTQTASNQSKSDSSQLNAQQGPSLPVSSKLSLQGTFKPTNLNLDSDLLIVFEDLETVSISNGCNMHSGFYSAFENGTLKFGDFFSTSRVCKVDFDKSYLEALKQSDSFTRQGKDLSLKSGNKLTLSLAWQVPQSPALPSDSGNSQTIISDSPKQVDPVKPEIPVTIPQTAKNNQSNLNDNTGKDNPASSNENIKTTTTTIDKTVETVTTTTPLIPEKTPEKTPLMPEKPVAQVFLTGEYTTDVSLDQDLRVKFENGTVSIINGCNSHSAQYKAYDNESIWFGGFRSTRKACANDRDSIYLEALSSSVSWRRIRNQILLKQVSGASTIVLIPYVVASTAVTFSGKYLTNIVKISNLQIQFNGTRLTIWNGCNMHSTDYSANSLGQFSVASFSSTKRQCIIDYDSVYLNSLSASSKFESNPDNSQITLKNSNGDTTMILTLLVPAKPVTLSGTFVTDIKVTPSIQIKFVDSSVSIFGGCNTWTSTYQAYDNRTISFLPFASTNLLCKNDFDKIYVDALKNATTFANNNNEITLFDLSNKKTILLSVAPLAKQVTFEGNYTTSIPNDPDFLVKFSGSQVSLVNGCNSFSGSYEADSLGNIVFKQLVGTLRACSVDNDGLYTKALSNSVSYETNGSRIILRDSKKEETMVLSLLRADFVKLNGKFSTNLPDDSDLLVEFSESTVNILNGCNAQSATYQAFSNASISFTPFISTLKFCPIDHDSKYTSALASSQSFVQNSNSQIILKNGSGITTLILTPFVPKPQPKPVSFNSTYKPNLNDDSDLLIKLENSNKVSISNGCNVQSGTYEAYEDGSIKFSQFMSTRMFCPNDKDSVYTTALTSSTKYIVSGEGSILLQNSNNQQTMLLSPYVNTTKQEAKRVYLGVGNYTTSIKEDSDLVVSIGSERINLLNGCNTYGADYKAYSNGSIRVGEFIGTEKACRLDFDYLYLNALSDSSVFSESSNSIVLKDDYNQTTLILTLNSNSSTKPTTNTGSISTNSNNNNGSTTNNNNNNNNNIKSSRSQSSNASSNAGRTAEISSKGSNGNTVPQVMKQADRLSKTEDTIANPQAASERSYESTDVKVYYSITPALKIFEGYFIISEKDQYLGEIMSYLEQDYYYFLKEYEIVGGFHKFRGDSLDYQIVFKSLFGTFNAVLEYRPSNARRILLKSLALLDLSALLPTYEGCESKDLTNRNCTTCAKGYRNFRGRCFLLDDQCLSYVADQCFKCKTTLFQGACRA